MTCPHLKDENCNIASLLSHAPVKANPEACVACSSCSVPLFKNIVTVGLALNHTFSSDQPAHHSLSSEITTYPPCSHRSPEGVCSIVEVMSGVSYQCSAIECNVCKQVSESHPINKVTCSLTRKALLDKARNEGKASFMMPNDIAKCADSQTPIPRFWGVGDRLALKIKKLIKFFPFLSLNLDPESCGCSTLQHTLNVLPPTEILIRKNIYTLQIVSAQVKRTWFLKPLYLSMVFVVRYLIVKSAQEAINAKLTDTLLRNKPTA